MFITVTVEPGATDVGPLKAKSSMWIVDTPDDGPPGALLVAIDIEDGAAGRGDVAVVELPPLPQPERTVAVRTAVAASARRVREMDMGDLRGRWAGAVRRG
jgi:hypothetical protein